MSLLGAIGLGQRAAQDKATEQAEVRQRLQEQERRVRALDRAVEVIQRALAEESTRAES